MKINKRMALFLILILSSSLILVSCSKKSTIEKEEKVESEEEVEELEGKIERIMKDYDKLIEKVDLQIVDLFKFIDENIEIVGEKNSTHMLSKGEEILKTKAEEIEKHLKDLDKDEEIIKRLENNIFLLEEDIGKIKNEDLKEYLNQLSKKPYKVFLAKNEDIEVKLDYEKLTNYEDYISEELGSYFSLMSNEVNNPLVEKGKIRIDYGEIGTRLINLENYLLKASKDYRYEEVLKFYRDDLLVYLKGSKETPVYDEDKKFKEDLITSYENVAKNKESITGYIINKHIQKIKEVDYNYNEQIEDNILTLLNEAIHDIEEKGKSAFDVEL